MTYRGLGIFFKVQVGDEKSQKKKKKKEKEIEGNGLRNQQQIWA